MKSTAAVWRPSPLLALPLCAALCLSISTHRALADTLGPNSPETCTIVATVDGIPWENPEDGALASDGDPAGNALKAYASIDAQTTYYLVCTDFGFTVPSRATIDGITVEWEQESDTAATVSDSEVRIVKGGAISNAQNKALPGDWPTADAYRSYGGAADLWGETWTVSNINSSGFGAAISATSSALAEARIDHVRITVDYTMKPLNSPNPGEECADQPETECITPDVRTSVLVWDKGPGMDSRVSWKFQSSQMTVTDFGSPEVDTNYILCMYDTAGGVHSLAIDKSIEPSGGIAIAAGGTCVVNRFTLATGDCWKVAQRGTNPVTGYRYTNRTIAPNLVNGVSTMWLRAGRRGNPFGGAVFFRGRGENLPELIGAADPDQVFDQDTEVLFQLVNSIGSCWESSYVAPASINSLYRDSPLFRDN